MQPSGREEGIVSLRDECVWGSGGLRTCEPAVQAQVTLGWDRVLTLSELGNPNYPRLFGENGFPPVPFPG